MHLRRLRVFQDSGSDQEFDAGRRTDHAALSDEELASATDGSEMSVISARSGALLRRSRSPDRTSPTTRLNPTIKRTFEGAPWKPKVEQADISVSKPPASVRGRLRSQSPYASKNTTKSISRTHSKSPARGSRHSKPLESSLNLRTKSEPCENLQNAHRKSYKCRSRKETTSWYEVTTLRVWDLPPSAASSLDGLTEGDLLLNWLDAWANECQVWEFTGVDEGPSAHGDGIWRKLGWGAPRGKQTVHRLIITEKGYPSFIAGSTWKKKYRFQNSRIVA